MVSGVCKRWEMKMRGIGKDERRRNLLGIEEARGNIDGSKEASWRWTLADVLESSEPRRRKLTPSRKEPGNWTRAAKHKGQLWQKNLVGQSRGIEMSRSWKEKKVEEKGLPRWRFQVQILVSTLHRQYDDLDVFPLSSLVMDEWVRFRGAQHVEWADDDPRMSWMQRTASKVHERRRGV